MDGGDWGSAVAEQLAAQRPDFMATLHLNDVPRAHLFSADSTEAERQLCAAGDAWAAQAAYISMQASRATTLALALPDSPIMIGVPNES